MNIVVDANLVAALVLPLSYSDQTVERFRAWKRFGVELCAPSLLEYETVAILRKAVVARLMTTELANDAIRSILQLHIACIAPSFELHASALRWAERLGPSKACDAHYVALAEQLHGELWTGDRRLVHSARQVNVGWVHWVGETET